MIESILFPVAVIGGLGVLFGVGLGAAGEVFKVETDERLGTIRAALPGANCGGCGFAGCDAFAAAVNEGKAKSNGCPVGGDAAAAQIAEAMGEEASAVVKNAAVVRCNGKTGNVAERYEYYGMEDCAAANMAAAGGMKACPYGCLGLGTCKKSCPVGAIGMVDGVAVVDKDKCVACGLCVKKCPRKIIALKPYGVETAVLCSSKDDGKTTRSYCGAGCIACKACERACEHGAIHVEGGLAVIDYDKCVDCGKCREKCPVKVIA